MRHSQTPSSRILVDPHELKSSRKREASMDLNQTDASILVVRKILQPYGHPKAGQKANALDDAICVNQQDFKDSVILSGTYG